MNIVNAPIGLADHTNSGHKRQNRTTSSRKSVQSFGHSKRDQAKVALARAQAVCAIASAAIRTMA